VTLLAADIGTTALKCVVFADDGTLLAQATEEYDLQTPAPGVVEIDVEIYWLALVRCVGKVLTHELVSASDIVAVSFSAQSETMIPCDLDGRALASAIVWLDTRATDEARALTERFDAVTCHRITGQVESSPHWPAAKIAWLRSHRRDLFVRTGRFLLLEDYFIQRLTGEAVTERSLCASSYYYDVTTGDWWPEMLAELGIRLDQLPTIVDSGVVVGSLRRAPADELGLPASTKLVTGGMDQSCAALGAGNVREGILSENTGGALAVCATTEQLVLDDGRGVATLPHARPDAFMLFGCTTGGITLRWFMDFLDHRRGSGATLTYEQLSDEAAESPPGSNGLLVLPHLAGAQSPEPNDRARGVLFGFTLTTTRADAVRAIFESICFVVRQNVEVIQSISRPVVEIRSTGGGAKSSAWKQIEADVTGVPVHVTDTDLASCRGAAVLAGVGAGIYADVAEGATTMVRTGRIYEPDAGLSALYAERYEAFLELNRLSQTGFDRY
jgi:xylulokinase